jgi:hypothetical protein
VVDPVVLGKLRSIYKRAATEDWVRTDFAVSKSAAFSGHYGHRFVWVAKSGIKELAETTMEVLTAASSVTTPSLAFNQGGVFAFISILQQSPTNSDFASQFLSGQLPPGVKTLVSNYTNTMNNADTVFWFTQALESGLNKTLEGWTTNEVYQFAASIQMTKSERVSSALRRALSDPVQSNDLLQHVMVQLLIYYPGVLYVKQNTYSVPFQNNLLLIPGGSIPIQH